MHSKLLVILLAGSFSLQGCETIESNSKALGALGGAGIGALACQLSSANNTECALLVAGGALAGLAIASYIDKDDEDAYKLATTEILSGQETSTQTSENTGNTILATRGETTGDCQIINVGYDRRLRGNTNHESTYCKQEDGTWSLTKT